MNRFAKAVFLASAGIFLGSQTARPQYSANNLLLGFDRVDNGGNGAQPADYVINLGDYQSSVGVGGGSVVNLTGYFNSGTFNGLYGSLSSGVTMGVVGGNPASSGRDIFATAPRLTYGNSNPNLPGSTAPDGILSTPMGRGANDVGAMAGANGLNLSAGQGVTIAQADANSFNTWILSANPPSYFSDTGIDPRCGASSSVLYEDLYEARNSVNGNQFSYLGFFTLDMTGQGSLTFTPSAVPEPSTWVLFAGGGALLLLMRRRAAGSLSSNTRSLSN